MTAARVVAAAALLVAGLAGPLASGQGCAVTLGGTLGTLSYTDCIVTIAGDTVVGAGAQLSLLRAQVEFTGAWTLRVDGGLSVDDSSVLGDGFIIDLAPGSSAEIVGGSLVRGHALLQARSPLFHLDDVTLEDAAVGLRVHQGVPSLHAVHFESCAVGLEAVAAARPLLSASSFDGVGVEVRGTPADGSAPTVTAMLDTFVDPAAIELAGTARFVTARALTVTVQGPGAIAPMRVDARDAAGGGLGALAQGEPARADLLLPVQERSAAAVRTFEPYRVAASSGPRANFRDLAPTDTAISLVLGVAGDTEAPSWSPGALQHVAARPGFANATQANLAWQAPDEARGSVNRAIARYEVLVDCVADVPCTPALTTRVATGATVTGLAEGTHTVRVRAVDLVGNAAESNHVSLSVDLQQPTLAMGVLGVTRSAVDQYASSFQVTFTAADTGSGLADVTVQVDDGPIVAYVAPVTIDHDGNYTVRAAARDRAGNERVLQSRVARDTSPPSLSTTLVPVTEPGGWSSQSPTLLVTASDAIAGVGEVRHRVGTGAWVASNASQKPALAPGRHHVEVEATDRLGNVVQASLLAAYDPDKPTLQIQTPAANGAHGWSTSAVDVKVQAGDDLSGLRKSQVRVGTGPWSDATNPLHLARSGEHRVQARASDAAGNEAVTNQTVRIDLDDPLPPHAAWSTAADGAVRANWLQAPAFDTPSGVQRILVEEERADGVRVLQEVPVSAAGATLSGLADGTHRVRLRVEDAAGRSAAGGWTPVTVRGGATGEVEHRTARGTTDLTGPGVGALREARFYLDGQLLAAVGEHPFTYSWDTRAVPDGKYTLRTVAFGEDGLVHQDVVTYEVRNGFGAVTRDFAWALVPTVALLALGGAACIARARYAREWALPGARHPRAHLATLAVLAFLSIAAPLMPRSLVLMAVWGTAAAAGLAFATAQGLALQGLRRQVACLEPPLQPGADADIDFDRPWRGGAP